MVRAAIIMSPFFGALLWLLGVSCVSTTGVSSPRVVSSQVRMAGDRRALPPSVLAERAEWCFSSRHGVEVYTYAIACPEKGAVEDETVHLADLTGVPLNGFAGIYVVVSPYWIDYAQDWFGKPVVRPAAGYTRNEVAFVAAYDWPKILRHELLHVAILRTELDEFGDPGHFDPIWDKCGCRAEAADIWPDDGANEAK